MNRKIITVIACVLAAGCVSAAGDAGAGISGRGLVRISGIPEKFTGGIILVTGSGAGGSFRYSPKVLQKIEDGVVEVNVYSETGMVQKPFTGSGAYTLTVTLHAADNPDDSETRVFIKEFQNGYAAADWNETPRAGQ